MNTAEDFRRRVNSGASRHLRRSNSGRKRLGSSFPIWISSKYAWFLSSFPGPLWSSPFPPVLSLGLEVSGSAEPALVFYALGTEHLSRCSQADNTRIEETSRSLVRPSTSILYLLAGFLGCALDPQSPLCLATGLSPRPSRSKK